MEISRNKFSCQIFLLILGYSVCLGNVCTKGEFTNRHHDEEERIQTAKGLFQEKDFRWPNRQLNVLIDNRGINETEKQILAAILDQIEHKTCIKVNRLSSTTVNPFDTRHLPESERNFIYIFKANFGLAHSEHPPLGLSSFGCVNQGRQSMVLGDLAFRWPDLVLRYHILRSLGLKNLTRPEAEVRQRLNVLPMSQKISDDDDVNDNEGKANSDTFEPAPTFFAYATFAGLADAQQNKTKSNRAYDSTIRHVPVKFLSDEDLRLVKELYNCSDYLNRLSPKPLNEILPSNIEQQSANFYSSIGGEKSGRLEVVDSSSLIDNSTFNNNSGDSSISADDAKIHRSAVDLIEGKINDTRIDDAAKSIMNQLISESLSGDDADADHHHLTSTTPHPSLLPPSSNLPPTSQCEPLESCPLTDGNFQQKGSETTTISQDNYSLVDDTGTGQTQKPMLLKLDEFHSQDPQLQQANQMKLMSTQLGNTSNLETYRLMNEKVDLTPRQREQQQQQFQLPQYQTTAAGGGGKSEMLISFEQNNQQTTNDPVSALASSQVLKLCSCTCQTMAPVQPHIQPQPLPTISPTIAPPPPNVTPTSDSGEFSTQTTEKPTTRLPSTTLLPPPPPSSTTTESVPTEQPTTEVIVSPTTPPPPTPTSTKRTSTDSSTESSGGNSSVVTDLPPITNKPPTTSPTTTSTTVSNFTQQTENSTQWTSTTQSTTFTTTATSDEEITTADPSTLLPTMPSVSTTSQSGSIADNPCDQVQWVKPNKTVYASAKIVWDVDRANQNYFLCNNQINDELIPGKTHGFSCKVGNEGRAYELHNFNVLTKPENVNLAWIQRTGGSLGKTNLPVIGGYSKNQDPLVVSRCLVRDENNDVITLIGYINTNGVGLFPFDDIQIECSQYDVLACVS